jgi:hypothetical protein
MLQPNLETRDWVQTRIPVLKELYGAKIHDKVAIITPYRRQVEEHVRIQFCNLQDAGKVDASRLTPDHFPKVLTIDSAQGTEAELVILDLTITKAEVLGRLVNPTTTTNQTNHRAMVGCWPVGHPPTNIDPLVGWIGGFSTLVLGDLGFTYEDNRACVTFTRAQKVLWIVSGRLQGALYNKEAPDTSMDDSKPIVQKPLCAILEYKNLRIDRRQLELEIQPVEATAACDKATATTQSLNELDKRTAVLPTYPKTFAPSMKLSLRTLKILRTTIQRTEIARQTVELPIRKTKIARLTPPLRTSNPKAVRSPGKTLPLPSHKRETQVEDSERTTNRRAQG